MFLVDFWGVFEIEKNVIFLKYKLKNVFQVWVSDWPDINQGFLCILIIFANV